MIGGKRLAQAARLIRPGSRSELGIVQRMKKILCFTRFPGPLTCTRALGLIASAKVEVLQ
jgi:hypothetical protein